MNTVSIPAHCAKCGRALTLQAAADCPLDVAASLAKIVRCNRCAVAATRKPPTRLRAIALRKAA